MWKTIAQQVLVTQYSTFLYDRHKDCIYWEYIVIHEGFLLALGGGHGQGPTGPQNTIPTLLKELDMVQLICMYIYNSLWMTVYLVHTIFY